MQMTRHGVRDLNGPKMDGRYNGRQIKCDCHRDPRVPTYSVEELRPVPFMATDHEGNETTMNKRELVRVYYCQICNVERFSDGD